MRARPCQLALCFATYRQICLLPAGWLPAIALWHPALPMPRVWSVRRSHLRASARETCAVNRRSLLHNVACMSAVVQVSSTLHCGFVRCKVRSLVAGLDMAQHTRHRAATSGLLCMRLAARPWMGPRSRVTLACPNCSTAKHRSLHRQANVRGERNCSRPAKPPPPHAAPEAMPDRGCIRAGTGRPAGARGCTLISQPCLNSSAGSSLGGQAARVAATGRLLLSCVGRGGCRGLASRR